MGKDGRVHTTFTNNPSTLRFSSVQPNLQNLPRGKDSEWARWVKEIFIAPDGRLFWARDFSGIEAVLVGYFAGSGRYVRLAKLGVHAFLCSHIIGRGADLKWSDADLSSYFKQVKKEEAILYDTAKRVVHGSNYLMTPRKMNLEYPETFPTTKDASRLQGLYFELFPEIRKWHRDLCLRVDAAKVRRIGPEEKRVDPWSVGVCQVRNPYGYVHRFYNVLDWELVSHKGGREWVSSFGSDAKRLIAFFPQSTAAAIIRKAARTMWEDFPWVGETLRLLIHDETFGEAEEKEIETCLSVSGKVMETPQEELPIDPTWGMGEFLSIGTEAKVGKCWATMH